MPLRKKVRQSAKLSRQVKATGPLPETDGWTLARAPMGC